jgi:hypothetical protein
MTSKAPLPTPDELRQQRLEMERRGEQEFIRTRTRRLWTAVAIGSILSMLCCVMPILVGHGMWAQICTIILLGTAWSVVVQFCNINHLLSCIVFAGASLIILISGWGFPDPLWLLGIVVDGALIGIVNEIYRRHILGH